MVTSPKCNRNGEGVGAFSMVYQTPRVLLLQNKIRNGMQGQVQKEDRDKS